MTPFHSHRGIAAILDRANIDTDAIIPKQFLKSILRTGFGPQLFFDWRYLADGQPNPDFVLNQPPFDKATVLVAGNNFGCGSSREHAVWAIQQCGFKVIIAPKVVRGQDTIPAFADIFRNNSFKNALLTIELTEAEVATIQQTLLKDKGTEITVDLDEEKLTVHSPKNLIFSFKIDASIRHRLLSGLDDIGLTLQHESKITDFEKSHNTQISPNP